MINKSIKHNKECEKCNGTGIVYAGRVSFKCVKCGRSEVKQHKHKGKTKK